jgi:ribosome maturation factor RimP
MINKNVFEMIKGARVIVILQNGKELKGKIVKVDEQEIFFISAEGYNAVISIDSIACVLLIQS